VGNKSLIKQETLLSNSVVIGNGTGCIQMIL